MITPSELFGLLSDETRLRCLLLLHKEKEICVGEFAYILDSGQPKISRHLACLRQSGVILDARKGQRVYYSLNPALPEWSKQILAALEHLTQDEAYRFYLQKIETLKESTASSSGTHLDPDLPPHAMVG